MPVALGSNASARRYLARRRGRERRAGERAAESPDRTVRAAARAWPRWARRRVSGRRPARLRRLVALKVPRPEVLTTPELQRRFLREGRAASVLAHPNLVPIFEVGDDGLLYYIAAAYCEGPSLAEWLKRAGAPLPCHEAASLVALLADAVAHAHARGVVHRDIKPSNVLLPPADAGAPTKAI
ncbi:MAG: hypothetical protein B7Z73_13140 [Planctomycetia bacterium 21-64-5]|nr:MAG: hypothetical protein B7Z73_13140 [Planctomycetia bacterium 21-64-5]